MLNPGSPRHAYARKNLREASVKMRVPNEVYRKGNKD